MRRLLACGTLLLPLLGLAAGASSAPSSAPLPAGKSAPDPAALRFFETRVRPVLAERCFGCHGANKQLGALRLDGRAALLKGGASGASLVPGDPEKSLFIHAIRYEGRQMPPGGKLKDAEIEALTEWVRMGAPWPAASGQKDTGGKAAARATFRNPFSKEARAYWAFQPVKAPTVPAVTDKGWSRTPIDRFIFQRLQKAGLTPAPQADRVSLIRRVTFDLTGLPPTPQEVDAFAADATPNAFEKVVDRLLASPRYGERWARHWLDLVRYADSDGYRIDDYRPHAWRYRDYVIRSFNQDKPYHRFVQEQLAGDELFPGDPDAILATGYLRHWIYEYNSRDVPGQWSTILNDVTDTTADVFMGMGLQCARCHDHKFDPLLQKDYYRLQAFFAPMLPRDDLTAATPEQRARFEARQAAWEAKTADLRARLSQLEAKYRTLAADGAVKKFPPDIQALLAKPAPQRTPLEHQLAELAYRQVDYEYGRLDTRFKDPDKEAILALRKQLAAFDKEKPEPLPVAIGVTDVAAEAPPVRVPKGPKTPVEPGFLTVLDPKPATVAAVAVPTALGSRSTGRRAALARWLTRPENPLTSRVMVNRIWQYHFGRGLAANASDFGTLGDKPTHPELLDWLATRFVKEGWSFKKLHRLILLSSTYQQSTHWQPARFQVASTPQSGTRNPQLVDPENRLYWRGNTRRLDAEQIRDALLAVTGELKLPAGEEGGPGSDGSQPCRSIYTRVMRNNRNPLLEVFDLPQFINSSASRDTTTTPVQSLLLINSQLTLLRAQALTARLMPQGMGETMDETKAVTEAYRLTYSRAPRAEELDASLRFLREQAARINPADAGSASAAFLHEKMPFRDGQAAVMNPEGPQRSFQVPASPMLSTGSFTAEAFVLVRSVYDSGAMRTIVSRWDGNSKTPGWAFGVTGKQSRRKPQTLGLQLWGKRRDGSFGEEVLYSDQLLQLNKPYYVAASIQLAGEGPNAAPGSVTFYLKDLSNDDEPLQVAKVPHNLTSGLGNTLPLVIGNRAGNSDAFFHGLIDDVRISASALTAEQILYAAENAGRSTVGYWQFEAKPDVFRDASGNGLHLRPGGAGTGKQPLDPRRAAFADLCHVLLNSSEFLYVD